MVICFYNFLLLINILQIKKSRRKTLLCLDQTGYSKKLLFVYYMQQIFFSEAGGLAGAVKKYQIYLNMKTQTKTPRRVKSGSKECSHTK